MKKGLLVTLADRNYLDPAKQLFSSAYFNAGWRGDYMLLSHEIPDDELNWFRDKGILVKKCKVLWNEDLGKLPATVLSKFYMFTPEFKKWGNIIYIDGDTIVRASLDELTKIRGFAAVSHGYLISSRMRYKSKLALHFAPPNRENRQLYGELTQNYNLNEPSFVSSLMTFSTDIIEDSTFGRLMELFKLYNKVHDCAVGEQATFNLFFYKRWQKLSPTYNVHPLRTPEYFYIRREKIKAVAMHFACELPWNPKSDYYQEWKHNLERAGLIDLKNPLPPCRKYSEREIQEHWRYLTIRHLVFLMIGGAVFLFLFKRIDSYIGKLGKFLRKILRER